MKVPLHPNSNGFRKKKEKSYDKQSDVQFGPLHSLFCLLRITLCFQFSIKNGQTRSSCSREFCHSQLISITMTSISSHVQPAHIKHSVEFIFFSINQIVFTDWITQLPVMTREEVLLFDVFCYFYIAPSLPLQCLLVGRQDIVFSLSRFIRFIFLPVGAVG